MIDKIKKSMPGDVTAIFDFDSSNYLVYIKPPKDSVEISSFLYNKKTGKYSVFNPVTNLKGYREAMQNRVYLQQDGT